jgi:hypothetical protein
MKPETRPEPTPRDDAPDFADDVLRGADAIAKFIFGENGSRRKYTTSRSARRFRSFELVLYFVRGDPFS